MADTTTQITRPAPFIETLGKTFGEGVSRLGAKPIDTSLFQPTVAAQGALGQAAQSAAASQAGLGALTFDATSGAVTGVGQGTGIAGYQPYLGQAVTHAGGAAGLTGTGAGTGAGSIESYMSPYTTNVIQAMQDQMADVKSQQDIARNASAVGAGAFGGARQGVAQSVADTEYNRMVGQMVAQQQGMGYQQAAGARQQDYANQMGLGQNMQGLAQLQPQLAQQNIQNIGGVGQQEQAYRQAIQDTAAQQQKLSLYEPYQRYGFMGEQLTGLMGGYPGGSRMTTQPSASPMSQALGMGIAGGLGYAGMKNMMG
jgi:hypothetical protein